MEFGEFIGEKCKYKTSKWKHYLKIYDRYFRRHQETKTDEVVILEIGVAGGGSLAMWNHYFGGKCKIYGIDIDPQCRAIEKDYPNIKVMIGDQSDSAFLIQCIRKMPPIDIIIDDGSHIQNHIITSFNYLYHHLKPGGTYFVEDLHTSYWPQYGGGEFKTDTFIGFSKKLVDEVNCFHIPGRTHTDFAKSIASLHYYDSVCVIEKTAEYEKPEMIRF